MKKTAGIIIKILAGFIVLILVILITIPVIFKDKIRTKVEQTIASSLNATVRFDDYKLGFFRDFPNLTFSLSGLSVVGAGKFENDTLTSVESFTLVFNLSSLFKKTGYEINSVLIDKADINTIVLKDGSANWDIVKDTAETTAPQSTEEPSSLKILLRKVSVINSSLSYEDAESDIRAYLNNLSISLRGDMTMSETDMQLIARSGEFTYIMEGMKYLNKTVLDADIDMLANIDKMIFTFRENYLSVNDLKLNFSGYVAMPGDDIETDIMFKTPQTEFRSILSLIPAVYMKDYQDLKTSGEFALSGSAKGIYSDADSTMPDLTLNLSVANGMVSYPSLPEQIKNINIKSDLFVDGKDPDKTTVAVDKFHLELAGSPFDMTFSLRTPVSDPDFSGSLVGRMDLSALSRALPLDSISLSGIIDVSVRMAGRMSMLEKEQYEGFNASGKMTVQNMHVAMAGYPEIKILDAGFDFTPAWATMTNTTLTIGKRSDFNLSGRLANYIPYFLKDQTIRGSLSMRSKLIDVSDIMSEFSTDTTQPEDTTSLAVIHIPENIDFDFDALTDELRYGKITGKKVKGHLIVRDGILSIKETGMNIMSGALLMNAEYDTRDTLKPIMSAAFEVQNIAIKDAFSTFSSVSMLAPASKGMNGNIDAKLDFKSLLGRNMMPVTSSISGTGKLNSDEITLVESETFSKMKEILKLGANYNNTFRDVNVSFRIDDGRVYVSPFDVRTGNLKMNISGDQGLDQTMNYLVRTEMPRSDLGSSVNSLIDNLSAQAAAFGISFKPADVIRVNLKVTGTFTSPTVLPVFGNTSSSDGTGNESALKSTVQKAEEGARDKAKAEAEKQAEKLLKEAEEKGQIIRDEAAKAAESIRKEADIQAKKMIDDSAKKSSLEQMAARQGADALRKSADKKAGQLIKEADVQAGKLVEEAKLKGAELIEKI